MTNAHSFPSPVELANIEQTARRMRAETLAYGLSAIRTFVVGLFTGRLFASTHAQH